MCASELSIHGIGARVTVQVDGDRADELRRDLTDAWSRCLEPAAGPAQDAGRLRFRLDAPGEASRTAASRDSSDLVGAELTGSDLAELLCVGTQAITGALIRAQVGRLLLFHAGAVSHPVTGRTLVFVAAGGVGKTTLARTLASRYGYLSDETVAIDDALRVLAYPKPLSLRTERGWPKQETSPDALGLARPGADPVVAQVVVLSRDPAAVHPQTRELGLLDAIEAITPQSSSLYALPAGLHRCADLIDATAPVLEVSYAEAESLLPLVADLIGAP